MLIGAIMIRDNVHLIYCDPSRHLEEMLRVYFSAQGVGEPAGAHIKSDIAIAARNDMMFVKQLLANFPGLALL